MLAKFPLSHGYATAFWDDSGSERQSAKLYAQPDIPAPGFEGVNEPRNREASGLTRRLIICCIAAIGFERVCERRSSWMRTRSGRDLPAFFQRACRKRVAALRAVDEMNVIRIDR
jgi:hypothetical protein